MVWPDCISKPPAQLFALGTESAAEQDEPAAYDSVAGGGVTERMEADAPREMLGSIPGREARVGAPGGQHLPLMAVRMRMPAVGTATTAGTYERLRQSKV
jgi:hypothetical protein